MVQNYQSVGISTSPGEITLGTLDADKAIGLFFNHSHTLKTQTVHFQCATLYTSKSGERRVRVLNLALPVATLASNVFRFSDMDTCICLWTKRAAFELPLKPTTEIRDSITQNCVSVLLGYREQCSPSTPTSQVWTTYCPVCITSNSSP